MATLVVRGVLETGFRWGMEQNFSLEWRADVFGRGKGDCDGGAICIHSGKIQSARFRGTNVAMMSS